MKLDKFQKETRKNLLRDLLAAGGVIGNDGANVTAAFLPSGMKNGNGHFTLAYAGNEKFNRKYGEYVALDRLFYEQMLPINQNDFYDFLRILCNRNPRE